MSSIGYKYEASVAWLATPAPSVASNIIATLSGDFNRAWTLYSDLKGHVMKFIYGICRDELFKQLTKVEPLATPSNLTSFNAGMAPRKRARSNIYSTTLIPFLVCNYSSQPLSN